MHLMIRPSKTFLFDILEKKLSRITDGVAVDAASANFKNRGLFKTKQYYGLDFDKASLEDGLSHSDTNAFAILADLANLEMLSSNSVRAVVSTNTLYHLPLEARKKALDHLCRITAPSGVFICEFSINGEFDQLLDKIKQNFKSVQIIYFSNTFSRAYECIFQRQGFLGAHPIAGLKPLRLLSWLISKIEYLTCRYSFLNKHALIIAEQKNTTNPEKQFETKELNILGERFYGILPTENLIKEKMERKKILIIITKGEIGGAQVSVFNLSKGLAESGYEVMVGFGRGEFLKEKLSENKIPFIRFKHLKRTYSPVANLLFIWELKKFLDKNKFDAIHFNSSNALLGAIGAKFSYPSAKTIFTFRGLSVLDDNFSKSKITNWLHIKIFQILLKFIDKQVYVSQQNQKNALKLGLAQKDVVIYNGLSPKNLNFLSREDGRAALQKKCAVDLNDKIIIGSIGRLAYQKNYEFLIKSAAEIKNRFPHLIWIIIGDGPDKEKLIQQIKDSDLENCVVLLGEIKDGLRYLKAFDIFILTSRYEGLSVSLLEAIFSGSSIIASNVGGNYEVLKNDSGKLYDLDNASQFLDTIQKMIMDSSQREKLSQMAMRRAEEFTIEKTVQEYKKIIEG